MNDLTDIDYVERYLRTQAADKAVADADKFGWTEVRRGVFLDTAERMKATGQDAEGAPYWMSTNDGEPPVAIQGAQDSRLRAMVDVDRDLDAAALKIDARDAASKVARAKPAQDSDLADPAEVEAHQSHSRRM